MIEVEVRIQRPREQMERMVESMVYGVQACRVCLGTDGDPYDNDLGHEARPRELKRIAELLRPSVADLDAIAKERYDCLIVTRHFVEGAVKERERLGDQLHEALTELRWRRQQPWWTRWLGRL